MVSFFWASTKAAIFDVSKEVTEDFSADESKNANQHKPQISGSEEFSYTQYAKSFFKNHPSALKLIAAEVETISNYKITYGSLTTQLPKFDRNYEESGIVFAKHKDRSLINEIQSDIQKKFNKSNDFYTTLINEDYREIVKNTQDLLNKKEYARRIANECKSQIKEYLQEDKFYIQTNLYLRATRPNVDKETESVGWHRETFYGPNMGKSINLWTPILGVNNENTLRFIPNSQDIPESSIITNQITDKVTKKESAGHVTGLLYAPKIIIGGIDLNNAIAMNVPEFHSSIFSGLLIHGSALNFSQNIRFSVDLRILPYSAYKPNESKQLHITSNKPYFELF